MSSELREDVRGLSPIVLQQFLRSRGWVPTETHAALVTYQREGVSLDVPMMPEYADYPRRAAEAITVLARVEGATTRWIVDELLRPDGDVLAVRVASDLSRDGTLPLRESLRLREGARNLLLAAAHSALSPQPYFARLSRATALALVDSVREGQTLRGSFVSRFIVPVDPAVGASADDEAPYGRRVVRLLMGALQGVERVRSLGDYDGLLKMEREGVSGNLLSALATMRPPRGAGTLELSVAWSRHRARPEKAPTLVKLTGEALSGLESVAEGMRQRAQTRGFEVIGYVTRLERAPGEPPGVGEVSLVPRRDQDVEFPQVAVKLGPQDYECAIAAHRTGQAVRVLGTLGKSGRRWTLADAAGFEVLDEATADDDPRVTSA